MEQGKGLIVGIDIGNEVTQAGVYDEEKREVHSVNLMPDSKLYTNPAPLDTIIGLNGKDADIDSLVKILKTCVSECMRASGANEVLSVCVTLPYFHMDALNMVRDALARTGIAEGRWQIISRTESFAHYAYSQKKELYISGVTLFDYDRDGIRCERLGLRKIDGKVCLVQETGEYTSDTIGNVFEQGAQLEDVEDELCAFIDEYFAKRTVSAVYLTGEGFDTQELPPKFAKQLVLRRKAYIGQNLYARGACYAALELLSPDLFKDVMLLLDNRVKYGIETDIYEHGQLKRFRIIRAGTNWYMADRTMDFILDDQRSVTLKIITPDKRFYDEVIDISEIPFREGKTTRISMNVRFTDVDRCLISIKDKGFGEFFKSSGRVIYKELDFKA